MEKNKKTYAYLMHRDSSVLYRYRNRVIHQRKKLVLGLSYARWARQKQCDYRGPSKSQIRYQNFRISIVKNLLIYEEIRAKSIESLTRKIAFRVFVFELFSKVFAFSFGTL